jgi:hypothetical protein
MAAGSADKVAKPRSASTATKLTKMQESTASTANAMPVSDLTGGKAMKSTNRISQGPLI